jgi:hypothetical protein
MSFETYNVYFSGQIMKDRDPAEVRSRIGKLFKLDGAKLGRLFSGQPVAIKKGLDMEQATKYRVVFREAGALVDIRPAGQAPQAPTPAGEPPGRPEQPPGLSLSAPNGYDLSDCAPSLAPGELPDISELNLDKPGVTLDTRPPPEPLEIDTDDWNLDRPGVTLDATEAPPRARIDTSALTLNAANQGSLEDCREPVKPVPLPNIDHLACVDTDTEPRGKARFRLSED